MITLLKNSIKASIRDSLLSICLLILLISIGVNCFNFSLYQFREAQRTERIYSGEYTYTLWFSQSADSEKLNSILQKHAHSIECAYVTTCRYGDKLRAYFCGNFDVSQGDKDLKENQIIIGEEKRKSEIKIDDTVNIDQCEYTVIGIRAGGDYDEISIDSLRNQYMIEELNVTFKNILSTKERNNFFKEIGTDFKINEVKEPFSGSMSTRYLYLFKSAVFSLIIVLCNINYVAFFFLIKKETTIKVMIMCGSTRLKIMWLNLFEMLLYAVLGVVLGNAFFFMFLSKGFIFDYLVPVSDILISCTVGILITVFPILILTEAKALKLERKDSCYDKKI